MRFDRFAKEMKSGSFGRDTSGIESEFNWPNENTSKNPSNTQAKSTTSNNTSTTTTTNTVQDSDLYDT